MVMHSPRLDAVLRAGEAYRLSGASYSGAPGDSTISYAKNSIGAPGDPPKLPQSKSAPAVPAGFTSVKGKAPGKKVLVDSETGNQIFAKSSEVVKDLINEFKKEQMERMEKLKKDRADAETCAQRRVEAINKFRDEESEAARATIAKLEEMLKKVEKSRDDLQSASDDSLAKIEKMTREGGESSKQVEELKKAIEQLKAEKKSVEDELAAKVKSCNEERDAATAHEAAELAKLAAEWQAKLTAAEKAAAEGDSVSSKKIKEYTSKWEKATEELEAKTKEIKDLEKDAAEQDTKFRKAAKAACDALSEYLKENSSEAFRKKTKDFVTSASAEDM
jgi:DNA repair exonuclease SbcCD ATPase subunit